MTEGVVVTGMGLVTPVGTSVAEVFDALCTGRSGLSRPPEGHPLAASVDVAGFGPEIDATTVLPATEARVVDRYVVMALCAARDALADAGLVVGRDVDPYRVGVIVSGTGGLATLEAQVVIRTQRGRLGVSPYLLPGMLPNMGAARIAIKYGIQGYSSSIATACAAGAQSIGEAASRPFDRRRNGLVLGEGAGVFVLERAAHADARGAAGYADVLGWGATNDAHHPTTPRPDGSGAAECMRRALSDAGIAGPDVGYLNAHGTSTKLGDLAEATAIRTVFGTQSPPVSSSKAVTGHMLGASGVVESAASVMAMLHGLLPPTHNLDDPDPACELDHIRKGPRAVEVDHVMSNSFGFGGHNISLVFGRPSTRHTRTV
ncbi:MAG: beta-ketoacyl synthase [Actinobacteria bacterium 13_2_20CM_2_71_6]|nr:MAG: beta-ketoacyl synthase [Actinobacteria bacterium 13_2_20CM_2_71_6]